MRTHSPTHSSHPGEGIRRRRESAGLSRVGLAFKAGIDISTVVRVENGKVLPRRSTLKVIEGALADEAAA